MRGLRLCLATALLLVLASPAPGAEPPPPQPVEKVPPQEALAVLGLAVSQPDGKQIGHLVDVLVNAAGAPQAGVIDVGGFLGVGSRKIAVHWSTLHFAPGNAKQPITVDLTLDQLKAEPEYRSHAQPAPVVLPGQRVEAGGTPSPAPAAASGQTAAPTGKLEADGPNAGPAPPRR